MREKECVAMWYTYSLHKKRLAPYQLVELDSNSREVGRPDASRNWKKIQQSLFTMVCVSRVGPQLSLILRRLRLGIQISPGGSDGLTWV